MELSELQKRLRESRQELGRAGHRRLAATVVAPVAIALGADHGGYALKEYLKAGLQSWGFAVHDVGTHSTASVDYPTFAVAVARKVAAGECRFGVMVDAAGVGSCMAINKISGARGATCHDERTARNSREHNDANVLVLGANAVHPGHAGRIVRIWLQTEHAGGRHARRVDQINALDRDRS